MTGIEWTEKTWNPLTGCDKISAGCKHCYAETLSKRLHAAGNPRYKNGFELTLHWDKLDEPAKWRDPTVVFVNSMSDLLHRDVPSDFIDRAFDTMATTAARHTYQVLTKRPERWAEVSSRVMMAHGAWPVNVWPGTTVENRAALARIEHLAAAGDDNTIRMLSVEPLLESLVETTADDLGKRMKAARIGWVITGGEAGFKARPAEMQWFREVRDACQSAGIAYFHKQHGGIGVTKAAKSGGVMATIDGVLHHNYPAARTASV